ncbi:DUF6252 family protein [Lacinutrix iliipiscaria]|uniref:DUF6252 family protein n=1 Tax=Lacinutrix iliipiscaria TaxID=1230532 RepID=A0ABW5WJI3_9FLAO
MRKLLICLLGVFLLHGCAEEIEFNNPSVQANKDGQFWRATNYQVDIDDGAIIIRGGYNSEAIWLLPNDDVRGTYVLGENAISEARFVDENDLEYSTRYEPDPSVQLYPADGQIIIESFDEVDGRNTVTGTFWFNAFTPDGLQKINFNEGHFYRIPFTGGLVVDPILSCDESVAASAAALETYNATDEASEEFPAVCNAYIAALMNQITSCGDETNVIQDIIDGLDCSEIVVPGECQTCTGGVIPDSEYCDNGDGTMDVTTGGSTTTVDLGGVSFEFYIEALESSGSTCN